MDGKHDTAGPEVEKGKGAALCTEPVAGRRTTGRHS